MSFVRRPEAWVFLILFGSYAFFWQSRDWNSASRLMLTYSLADRGTVRIDGLEDQTRDRARIGAHYYSDKFPGSSILGLPPYLIARFALGLPAHPLRQRGFAHWWADYWVTLFTSGLATAIAGCLLTGLAKDLGCGPGMSSLVGLSYGLATPAFPYATMFVGHQPAACALLASFVSIRAAETARRPSPRIGIAGFLASLAVSIELPLAPVAAILGLAVVARILGKRSPPSMLLAFGAGAMIPIIGVFIYDTAAFGSPFDLGYFHEDLALFRDVHNADNPLGLTRPDGRRVAALLWGRHRGLLFYAPVIALAVPGWLLMIARRRWELTWISLGSCLAVFIVNLSYPNWTGGWSTGPRLLVPLLPFAMLGVAVSLAEGGIAARITGIGLSIVGGIVMLLFVGVGARLPDAVLDPLTQAVWPLWSGARIPPWWIGERFARNLVSETMPGWVKSLPTEWRWLQFAPLMAFQAVGTMVMAIMIRKRQRPPTPARVA